MRHSFIFLCAVTSIPVAGACSSIDPANYGSGDAQPGDSKIQPGPSAPHDPPGLPEAGVGADGAAGVPGDDGGTVDAGTEGGTTAPPPPVDSTPDPTLDALIPSQMGSAHIAGLAACAVMPGKTTWCKAYGAANVEKNIPVTLDTPFLLASVSKTVVAVALMQMWEKKDFGLDDPIAAALPWPFGDPAGSAVTYRTVMTHTSSIHDNEGMMAGIDTFGADPAIPLAQFMQSYFDASGSRFSTANFNPNPPGTNYEYSNMAIGLLGYLGEVFAKEDFRDYSKQSIFAPLRMTHTSWRFADFHPDDIAMPYGWSGSAYQAYGHYTFAHYPCGGLFASAPDVARFLAAFAQLGELDGARILEAATVQEMRKQQVPPSVIDGQGLVWYLNVLDGQTIMGHEGMERGVATRMFFRPSDGAGFVVLTNADPEPARDAIDTVASALLKKAASL